MFGRIWKLLYSRWGRRAGALPGYSLLLPVPGDLPFFLDIFERIFRTQSLDHMVEALVLPDMVPPGLAGRFDQFAKRWPGGKIRMVPLEPKGRWLAKLARNPHANYWLQITGGVKAARATHVIFHDADAFITAPDFFDAHYRECVAGHYVCQGVGPAWDPFYRENGLTHLTATWEMIAEADWLRSFPPWMHRGHDGEVLGKPHTFDVTFLPQCLTPPEKVSYREQAENFIHFNYVICTYRFFQDRKGPFDDENFRVLLIRLLIDAFDPGDWPYDAPSAAELARGLTDPTAPATYLGPRAPGRYAEFRDKLQHLLDSPILDDRQREAMLAGIRPFDHAFGTHATAAPAGASAL